MRKIKNYFIEKNSKYMKHFYYCNLMKPYPESANTLFTVGTPPPLATIVVAMVTSVHFTENLKKNIEHFVNI